MRGQHERGLRVFLECPFEREANVVALFEEP